jgi:hypothetical protein
LKLPALARCRCGEVQIRISAAPIMTMICHCKGCQRMTGSAYSLSAAIPSQGFEVVSGEPVIGGLKNPELKHYFCPQCMSWLFTRFTPEWVNLRVTMLEDIAWYTPFLETWSKTRLPWVTVPAARSYEEFPPMEDFGELVAEFSRLQAP